MSCRDQGYITYLNIKEAIHSKMTSNIRLKGDKDKAIPLKSLTKQVFPLSQHLSTTLLDILARAIRQRKETKRIQIRREEVKVSLLANYMIVFIIY